MKKIIFALVASVVAIVVLINVFYERQRVSSCESCHKGIEHMSDNHLMPCVDCHGGDAAAQDKDVAHKNMIGGKNPSDPAHWEETCGKCHEHHVKRVSSTIMLTNSGIIKNTLEAWAEEEDSIYSTAAPKSSRSSDGTPITIKDVADLDKISADMYRKFCSACHVGSFGDMGYKGAHSSGCAACHFSYGEFGEYLGGDEAMKGKEGYAATHKAEALPTMEVCAVCHSRSGRIALSYQGLYDGNNALVPTKDALPGPDLISGVRNVRHMKGDIHFLKGMECIDCHTSYELMGDGYFYENMYHQVEISCESCHGSYNKLPETQTIDRENLPPLTEGKNYKKSLSFGDEAVLTDKGRMYSNVYKKGDEYILISKRTGVERKIKTITGSDYHQETTHGRLACYTCHSSAVVQCYGCHVEYDERQLMADYIKNEETPGLFTETEDLRTFFPFPLAFDQKGKIVPATPGCQTFLTHIDKDGNKVKDEYVFNFRGTKKLKFAPFFGHNVGETAVTCEKCHSDPMFYGFGEGLFSSDKGILTSAIVCDSCDIPLLPLYHIEDGKINVASDIVRQGSQILGKKEINAMLNANKCIICHTKGENKYYKGEIDYDKILNDNIHKPLFK
ncbi:MAG: cytochrome C [Deferribacterales bacterium]|nr:cytochrome C [Deferribacterales bacterium]